MHLIRAMYNSRLIRRVYRTRLGRFVYHAPGELVRWLARRRDPMTPPMWAVYTGRGDFGAVGRDFLRYFVEIGGLKPHHRVLDVGSGMGRMAVPLTGFLSPQGRYTGIEIVREGVDWCTRKIAARFSNFAFLHVDVRNDLYNPSGASLPHEYRFPFADGSFDFAFLTSVFTHMDPAGVRNYLREVGRVLAPLGRCLFTCSLIDEGVRQRIAAGSAVLDFRYRHGEYWSLRADGSTHDVAFDTSWVLAEAAAAGLRLVEPIHYGNWSGRRPALSHQDIVVVEKPAPREPA